MFRLKKSNQFPPFPAGKPPTVLCCLICTCPMVIYHYAYPKSPNCLNDNQETCVRVCWVNYITFESSLVNDGFVYKGVFHTVSTWSLCGASGFISGGKLISELPATVAHSTDLQTCDVWGLTAHPS